MLSWVLPVRGGRVLVGSRRGGRKSVLGAGVDRVNGLTTFFGCVTLDALFLGEKVWGGMMLHNMLLPRLIWGGEHDGALKITEKVIIKVILAIYYYRVLEMGSLCLRRLLIPVTLRTRKIVNSLL